MLEKYIYKIGEDKKITASWGTSGEIIVSLQCNKDGTIIVI